MTSTQVDMGTGSNEPGVRQRAAAIAVLIGIIFCGLLHFLLPVGSDGKEGFLAALLIDRGGFGYPVSIQNLMWLVFFVGIAELWVRHKAASRELAELSRNYLPEDLETVLVLKDLPAYFRKAATGGHLFLPRLIRRTILQFQTSRAVDQANSLLNSSVELCQHEIDLRYNMLRYIVWLIPTLGFIGTVVGISLALEYAGGANFQDPTLLSNVTAKLAVAFNTTLVALVQAGLLVFMMHLIQEREEEALNRAGQYCIDNLINRLYEDE